MATKQEAHQAVIDAIAAQAKLAEDTSGSMAATYAAAVKDLAEAHAWLATAAQPH